MASLNAQMQDSKQFRQIYLDCDDKVRSELSNLDPEVYDRLFLTPLRGGKARRPWSRLGNATPVGMLGFSVSVIPLAVSFSK